MLGPTCERCGSILAPSTREEFERRARPRPVGDPPPPGRRAAGRLVTVGLVALLAFAMTRAGLEAGGVAVAVSAFGVAVLLCVPLIASLSRARGRPGGNR